jgi:hypothetical protein
MVLLQAPIALFSMFENKKVTTMHRRLLLWFSCVKKVMVGSCHAIAFFSVFEKKKKMTTTHGHLLLWWCCREEKGDGNCCHHLLLFV